MPVADFRRDHTSHRVADNMQLSGAEKAKMNKQFRRFIGKPLDGKGKTRMAAYGSARSALIEGKATVLRR